VTDRPAAEWLEGDALDEWARFVTSSPTGSAYSLPAYLRVLSAVAGGRFRVLAVRKGDELAGGLSVYETTTALGPRVQPRLLLFYNGLVLREETTVYPGERASRELRVVTALTEALEQEGYRRIELRTRAPFADGRVFLARGWSVEPSYSYVVPLDDLEAQWERTAQNLRRLVRRGEREGFTLEVDADFDAFYALHATTHEEKGAPIYLPELAFRRYYEELRALGLCRLYQATASGGQVAASQLVLLGHPVTHTVSAGTDPAFAAAGATAFLRWRTFEHLAAQGFSGNDLTDATLSPVTQFKSQLGGTLETALVATRAARRDRLERAARSTARHTRDRIRRSS
jgi:hypothetical protein